MSNYELNGAPLDVHAPDSRRRLAAAHSAHERPLCLCRRPPIPMYIAKLQEAFIVKRMPGTGSKHSPDCESYDPPAELSGLGEVMDRAIKEDPENGETTLKLAFSMSKGASRNAPVPGDGETTTVKSDGTKLTLRSVLHYLWDQAGFNRWTPAMAGKRSYPVVRRHLLQAASDKRAKNAPLSDSLFIPEPFSQQEADGIAERARRLFRSIAGVRGGVRKLMIVVAEVKQFDDARFGKKVTFKHLPSQPFYMDAKFGEKLQKTFGNEIDMWNADEGAHLMLVGTFSVLESGFPQLEEAALMAVNSNWIPFETLDDHLLLQRLHADGRRFIKGLRFNLSNKKPLATVVTNDTSPNPVALYVVAPESEEDHLAALSALVKDSSLSAWFWRADEAMPPLPEIEGFESQSLDLEDV
ncbi:TPA: DUF1173 domain-containing protein [Stenotrophomonas maltophilia]|uniref:DUF1173 domain-containing protein n=1 Tax=Stenotrophomonas maltophilia TaxID=40324 RepID=A0AAI9CJW9_STEMA|nr:DUF1173 domain-containing protein [Stenotrophomonas maltophilia]EKU9962454.1 DUF1173 domain-containing protein [Stenotrophomonas maltophilia]EKZ1926543.1 DUF1173 domain-containing protein [Stenotrophomonas maltophilia]ELE7121234.1 DUF1173 domain-containing protein [Stenotrophomonas maltophilia]EMB2746790.1 DUF1173 domain-containing protein [Stenotrophomonas maltophilia]MBH1377184.1 DUF1173 domain-containing protein [Stenotrophomonas maltophilia]